MTLATRSRGTFSSRLLKNDFPAPHDLQEVGLGGVAELDLVAFETRKLEFQQPAREAFSFSVSHDLRAPLGAMDTYCGIIEKELGDKLGESGRRMFKVVREGTQRMERLIEDLLAFALLGRQPLSKQPISVSALVHEVVDDLHKEQFQRRIEVRVQDLPDCFGDPALLKQVFVNLLSNAFKFTRKKEEAVVEVGCEQKTGERIYFVRDNGVGFDMRRADNCLRLSTGCTGAGSSKVRAWVCPSCIG
jgi:light-regulated signal transduction histidine kinase (bacteriophytochrome)